LLYVFAKDKYPKNADDNKAWKCIKCIMKIIVIDEQLVWRLIA